MGRSSDRGILERFIDALVPSTSCTRSRSSIRGLDSESKYGENGKVKFVRC